MKNSIKKKISPVKSQANNSLERPGGVVKNGRYHLMMSINPDRKEIVMSQSYDVLLICSGGGHWVQMSKLLPAFDGRKVNIATVDISVHTQYPLHDFVKVPDFNRNEPLKIIKGFYQIFNIVYHSKAKYVISTGGLHRVCWV
ncbi:hypothetical protein ACFS4T_13025 [Pseudomonas lini]